MQLSRNLLGLIHIYSEDNRAKYLLVMRGNVYLAVHVMFAVKLNGSPFDDPAQI